MIEHFFSEFNVKIIENISERRQFIEDNVKYKENIDTFRDQKNEFLTKTIEKISTENKIKVEVFNKLGKKLIKNKKLKLKKIRSLIKE